VRDAPILVLGADGYIGWPLSLALAARFPGREIVLADNFLRRRLVEEVGGQSIVPVPPIARRVAAAGEFLSISNLVHAEIDVASTELERLLAEVRPGVVFHLAHQASAPYSMRGAREAVLTLRNNEESNLRLLFALRDRHRDTHLVKLGSFGEYAKAGIDVAEGYFQPTFRGQAADRPVPYPREADDVYHVTKINDSAFIGMACRAWGLRVTDLMQSTIYGVRTAETARDPALGTRLDQDECFGTVVNRFVAQALVGHPLSVYGTGLQRTGLMYLRDAIDSLVELGDDVPAPGEHRVINHVAERGPCVLELAESVVAAAREIGVPAEIDRGTHDPRGEHLSQKPRHRVDAARLAGRATTPLAVALGELLADVAPHRDRVLSACVAPTIRWAP
jgi:UDP-sulfoquinovose synthase